MDFQDFFDELSPLERLKFAERAGYSLENIRTHFAAPASRRRIPSGAGFARIVSACDAFRRRYPKAPKQPDLFAYFFELRSSRRQRATA